MQPVVLALMGLWSNLFFLTIIVLGLVQDGLRMLEIEDRSEF